MSNLHREKAVAPEIVSNMVTEALRNKYPEVDESMLAECARRFLNQHEMTDSKEGLLQHIRVIRDFEDDVSNHVVTLLLIENFWSVQVPTQPLIELHAAALGMSSDGQLRAKDQVADYPGTLSHASCVGPLLYELEQQVVHILPSLATSSLNTQSIFMAHLFGAIIRTHPFEDGNGRVARLSMQLCLRTWEKPFIVLPKVRNDRQWLTSLSLAVQSGDISPLRDSFLQHLKSG